MSTDTEFRADDQVVHPEAVAREQAALEEARAKDLRWRGGVTGWVMSLAGFATGIGMLVWERGSPLLGVLVLLGSFVGNGIASNTIPYTHVTTFVLKLRGGG